jgi:biopolymer transport protein ExbD
MTMGGDDGRGHAIAGINVTPMADIMIVLLVIFMVATSALNRDAVRDLPPASNADTEAEGADAIVVSVERDGRPAVGNQPFGRLEDLRPYLEARLETLPEGRRVVFVKAAQEMEYGDVGGVVDVCRRAGVEQVALMTAPSTPTAALPRGRSRREPR